MPNSSKRSRKYRKPSKTKTKTKKIENGVRARKEKVQSEEYQKNDQDDLTDEDWE